MLPSASVPTDDALCSLPRNFCTQSARCPAAPPPPPPVPLELVATLVLVLVEVAPPTPLDELGPAPPLLALLALLLATSVLELAPPAPGATTTPSPPQASAIAPTPASPSHAAHLIARSTRRTCQDLMRQAYPNICENGTS